MSAANPFSLEEYKKCPLGNGSTANTFNLDTSIKYLSRGESYHSALRRQDQTWQNVQSDLGTTLAVCFGKFVRKLVTNNRKKFITNSDKNFCRKFVRLWDKITVENLLQIRTKITIEIFFRLQTKITVENVLQIRTKITTENLPDFGDKINRRKSVTNSNKNYYRKFVRLRGQN